MRMSRLDLLTALEVLEPALAPKPIIEELTFIWFTGTSVYAYNDVIGIVTPLETEFQGGMKGSLILGLLKKSRAKEVEFQQSNTSDLIIKAANARLNLAYYEIERSLWEMPDFERSISFEVTPELIKAIDDVTISIGQDTSIPDQLGITLIPDGNILYLFSTDSKTISRAMIPFPCKFENRIILPALFCQQFVKLFKKGGRMMVMRDSVLAENDQGLRLFTRLIETSRPLEFHETVDSVLSSMKVAQHVPVPKRLKLAIERIAIVLEHHIGEPAEFRIADNVLHMHANTALGDIKDSMRLDMDHNNVELTVDPLLIKRAINGSGSFYLTPSCVVLSSENFIHLISASER